MRWQFLCERGARLVAASDSRSTIYHPEELDINALIRHKRSGLPVGAFAEGTPLERDDLVGVACDIWIPAARPDVLTEANVRQLKAKLILQGANIPATEGAERWLHEHGILSIPDFIANAGGVICAAVEYHGGNQQQAMATIAEKIHLNTQETLDLAKRENLLPRQAATSWRAVGLKRQCICAGYNRGDDWTTFQWGLALRPNAPPLLGYSTISCSVLWPRIR